MAKPDPKHTAGKHRDDKPVVKVVKTIKTKVTKTDR